MTNQQIFDRVAKHLLKQGARALETDGSGSVYYAENGNRCAIGCLIPKGRYAPEIEHCAVDDLRFRFPGYLEAIFGSRVSRNMPLLEELQRVHDMTEPSEWAGELAKTACKFGLKLPECLKAK